MNTKNAQEVIREAYERGYSGRLAEIHATADAFGSSTATL